MIGAKVPFDAILSKRVKVTAINRKREMNQMSWQTLKIMYAGLGLDYLSIEHVASEVGDLVSAGNAAAHDRIMPTVAAGLLESQLRTNVAVVENVLTDLSVKLLDYFNTGCTKGRSLIIDSAQ
jgi:hypothetical protein